ncbi:Xaa-Pro peptidase family protein [Labrys neptuniae]|uniref:M24 family metallopeptidase n=1 Tax=Labrys neptuniae TaxID=376174 RepID=UPI00288E8B7D|nr:Xaa-Pro peptidase family protein [Labrys neptuniae]MDT3377391.1 Xaa-Pro peptidase family protein [Labrys neptuniae]
MRSPYARRVSALCEAMAAAKIDAAILTHPDAIAYFAAYWNYLGMEFGRPTILVVKPGSTPTIITPLMEAEMCTSMSWIEDIRPWTDGGEEWRRPLKDLLTNADRARIGVEERFIPNVVSAELRNFLAQSRFEDIGPLVGALRQIKSSQEIATMRQAGEVAVAMMEGARRAIGPGVPEYEIALAAMAAGTRKAAGLLQETCDRFVSPLIHDLQILQSGRDTCMVHRRASTRRLESGDPVYLCFCGMVRFRNYKLGFDRQFFVGQASDEQLYVQEAAVKAQKAALGTIRPGVTCEAVNQAAEEAYAQAGFEPGYRTGRAVGLSLLEAPELKRGESALIEAGMTFAVDGGITLPGKGGGRIGDSIVVTQEGYDWLTPYPRDNSIV